jgi:hypothetical protein
MRSVTAIERWESAEAFGEDFEGSPCMVLHHPPTLDGYSRVSFGSRMVNAHRLIYEAIIGPIPEGATLDHRCASTNGLRSCVNPWHLEPVTMRENILRSSGRAAENAKKAACLNGHALSGDNLYVNPTTGHRYCRTCLRVYRAAWRRKALAAR